VTGLSPVRLVPCLAHQDSPQIRCLSGSAGLKFLFKLSNFKPVSGVKYLQIGGFYSLFFHLFHVIFSLFKEKLYQNCITDIIFRDTLRSFVIHLTVSQEFSIN
jgi:hypothetical protein